MGSIENLQDKISHFITMGTMWIILLILQLTTAYNIQKRSRALEVEGSGVDEDNMMLEIEDMMEENGGNTQFFESLFSFYSEVIESLKNYESLIHHFIPSFAAAVPRSLIDMGDKYDLEFVIESVRQFGLIVKGLASDLSEFSDLSDLSIASIPLYSIAAILSVVFIGLLYTYSKPILAILWVTSGLAPSAFFRTNEGDGDISDVIRTARGFLGEDFNVELFDEMTAGVLNAVDTYSMLQGLQKDFLE